MITLHTENYDVRYVYKIHTSFHKAFPAVTVTYRIDGKQYGHDMPIDFMWGSGGVSSMVSFEDHAQFSKEMSDAWKLALKIVKYHRKSKKLFKEKK